MLRLPSFAAALLVLTGGCSSADESEPAIEPKDPGISCGPSEVPLDDGCCPAGALVDDAGVCVQAGVAPEGCGDGFESDGDRGCTAILPAAPCPAGEVAFLGETVCAPIAPCGSGTWGDIPVDGNTQYVDGAHNGMSDGSSGSPWRTVQQGVDAAQAGAIVAIAAGDYVESVDVSGTAVRLWGRCPAMTRIIGDNGSDAVFVRLGAHGTELRDLSLSGPLDGVAVSGARNVLLDRVWIRNVAQYAVDAEDVQGEASVVVTRSLLEDTTTSAVFAYGASVTIERSVIRDTSPMSSDDLGRGIDLLSSDRGRSQAAIRGVIIDNVHDLGIAAFAADVTVENSLVSNTQPDVALGIFGRGIDVELIGEQADPASRAIVRQSVLTGNHEAGVYVVGSELEGEALVIRNSQPIVGRFGRALSAERDPDTGRGSVVTLRASLLAENREVSLNMADSTGVLELVAVRDTADQDGLRGRGVNVQSASQPAGHVELLGCDIADNHEFGVVVIGTDATLRHSAIRATAPQPGDGQFGDGLAVFSFPGPASVEVINSELADSGRAGIANFGAFVGMESNQLHCNVIHLDGEAIPSGGFEFDDRAGNVCQCEDIQACKVVSTMLQPPQAL